VTHLSKFKKQDLFIASIFAVLIILAFIVEPLETMFSGFVQILVSPSILLSDYLLIGGLGATLLNVALTLMLNVGIVYALKLRITGPIFACLLTIAGFAFFGKNIFNAIPIYFGIYLYSIVTKSDLKGRILVILLSSGISPIVSFLMFGLGIELYFSIPLGIATGVLVGFILPAFNAHALKFHQGYNLYNTGFSMGVLSMLLTGIISAFATINRSVEVYGGYHTPLLIATVIVSVAMIIAAFVFNPRIYKLYPEILKKSGRLMTDFVQVAGRDATMLNVGIMGLLSIGLVLLLEVQINGPIMGAILTIIGFAAFGKHPMNSIPVVMGAMIAVAITPIELTIGPILAIFFVTGLAPIAGRYGFMAGLLAGFIHLLITPLALAFQGGFDLYNNGFAAGFVAALLSSVFSRFSKTQDVTL